MSTAVAPLVPSLPQAPQFELSTVAGAEDLLIEELRSLGSARLSAPGVVDLDPGAPVDWSSILEGVSGRRFYTGIALSCDDQDLESTLESLVAALADLDVAPGFRVASPRPSIVRRIASVTGWPEQPGAWSINLRSTDPGAADARWLIDIGPLHWSRRHARLVRLPWSTPPVLAEVLVRLAKPAPGDRLLDPCCGAGTVLVAAGLSGVRQLFGRDRSSSAISAAQTNLQALGLTGELHLGDAAELQESSGSVQRMISNLPFGKRVGSHADNRELYPRLMAATARILAPDGRAVYLTEDKRLLLDAVQRTPGLKIIRQRLLQYSGASPTAYVITRNRRNGR